MKTKQSANTIETANAALDRAINCCKSAHDRYCANAGILTCPCEIARAFRDAIYAYSVYAALAKAGK